MRRPGFIELLRAPEGQGSGGGSEPSSGSGDSAPATPAAPAAGVPGGSPAPSSPSGAAPAAPAAKQDLKRSDSPTDREDPTPLAEDAFSGFGADESDEPQPTPKEPAAPVQPPPAETQPPDATAPQAPEQPPKDAAPQQPTPTGPQEAVPQLPSPAEPGRMGSMLLQEIEAFSDHLAKQPEFQLTAADIEAINSDVNNAIPKLLARTYIRSQASALNQMERVVPAMVERFMRLSKARDESEGKFYARWPAIDKAAHSEVVDRLAKSYRKENPGAPLQQMVEDLGPLVMMVAKIAPSAAAAPKNGSGGAPAAASGGRRPPASPFQPAVGGSASPPASAEAPNPWSGYGAQEDE